MQRGEFSAAFRLRASFLPSFPQKKKQLNKICMIMEKRGGGDRQLRIGRGMAACQPENSVGHIQPAPEKNVGIESEAMSRGIDIEKRVCFRKHLNF